MKVLSGLADRLSSMRKRIRGRETDARFESIFQASSVAMLWATPEGRISRANPALAKFMGYTVDELEGMPYENLLPAEDRREYREILAAEAGTRQSPKDRERRYIRKDGRFVWGLRSVTLVLSRSGEPLRKFLMIQDLTEQKEAEQALLEEERALAVLNRTAAKLNAELDLEAVLKAVTDAGVELVGAEFGVLYSCRSSFGGRGYKLHSLSGIKRECFEKLPVAGNARLFEPILGGAGVTRWDDILTDERFAAKGSEPEPGARQVRSYIAVPLVSRTKDIAGALFFGHAEPGMFTARDERLIAGLASHAVVAIEKASLFDAAQREIETRKSMEASLNESKARFREFAEVGSDLLWESDEEFRITSIVGDAGAVYGLSEESMVGRTLWQLAGADPNDPHWRRHIEDHQAWRPFRNFEYEVNDESGTKRWISTNGRPFFDPQGRLLGYRGSSTNIAARKHAETKLAASARQQQSAAVLSQLALQRVPREELYQVAVELVARTLEVETTGIMELSPDKRVLRLRAGCGWPDDSANVRAVPIDYCPPLMRGVNSDVPVHFSRRNFNLLPGRQNANGAGVAVPIGERSVRLGLLLVCSDGFRAFSESDTNFLRAVSFVLAADAEQRRTEATLRLRDRAMEAVGEGIMITDATETDNPVIYVNPAFERITGYSRSEVIGRNARFLQGEDTDERAVQAIHSAVNSGTTYRGSILNYRKDGSSFWNALSISPISDGSGSTSHFVGVVSDETERIELESQLKQAQKMESLGHLTGGVAHDFNNLLAVILGNSEILCDEIEDPDLKEIADLVMTTAEKGADLTQRLLAFGRRQPLHPEPTNLRKVISSLSEMLGRTIGDHLTLETRVDATRAAFVDRALCESAMLNLALNARDAMPNGGVLTIATEIVQFDDGLAGFLQPGEYICVNVTDTGTGMTKDVLDRAFDPFFTTKNLGKGSGMGLSMVYGFAKQSGGHVAIESQVGQGTTVRMYLPAAKEDMLPQEDKAPVETVGAETEAAAGGSERILVVEDEPQLRTFVSKQLSGLGYSVLEADAGAPALDILRSEEQIDLLFTDLIMPGGMSGFDLVEQARAMIPRLRVLLTTGYAAETDEMIANIKDPILKKPYKRQQLAQALRDVLERAA